MRAVVCRGEGGVEVMELGEGEYLHPQHRDIVVRSFAAGVNRADILQRRGLYPPPPGASRILGLEFAGEISAIARGVKGIERGARLFGLVAGGAYAELVTVDHRLAMPIPDCLSYDKAAAIPEAFFTAYDALFEKAHLKAGEWVLIHAGASGVGTAAIQLVRSWGGNVIATAGTAEKLALCRELGAVHAVNYREADFAAAVAEATDGAGVNVVLDLVGAKHWDANLKSIAPAGRWIVVGLVGGSKVELDLGKLLTKRVTLIGTVLRSRPLKEKIALTRKFVRHVLPKFETGELEPIIDSIYMLEDVREAHRRMERNENLGKIVLRF